MLKNYFDCRIQIWDAHYSHILWFFCAGAPGCYTWRGNLFGQQRNGLTTGNYAPGLHEDNYGRFTKHGHMGLAITSGRYFARGGPDDNAVHFVSGAPGAGEVFFFQQNDQTGRLELDDRRTIVGGNFGGGFGFSLETLDANRDGRDDLGRMILKKKKFNESLLLSPRGHGGQEGWGLWEQ
jgi:hypothetical protein